MNHQFRLNGNICQLSLRALLQSSKISISHVALYSDFQYLKLARSQKFYGYLQFKPCEMDFPESNSHVLINIGGYELNFRLIGTQVIVL